MAWPPLAPPEFPPAGTALDIARRCSPRSFPLRTSRFPRTCPRGGLGRLLWSRGMLEPAALLMTRDSSLVSAVREALKAVSNLGLRIVESADRVPPELQRLDVVLLLVHLSRDGSAAAVEQLLKSVATCRRPVPVIVLGDQNQPEQALALLQQGAADYLERPLDLRRLAYRADTLTAPGRLVGPRAPPA